MKVLIADDAPSERMLLRSVLRKWGYTVVEAEDGRMALDALADSEIHLAILDWMMPETDGLEICKNIQHLNRFVYAILVTGVGKEEDIAYALENGANDYIVKPFDPNQLRARLRVGERITSLQKQLVHLQKMESLGRMAEGLAHELNTPAQYVGGNLRYLKDSFTDLSGLLRQVNTALDAGTGNALPPGVAASLRTATEAVDLPFLLKDIPEAIRQSLEGVEQIADIVASMKQFANPSTAQRCETDLAQAIKSSLTVTHAQWKDVAKVETDFDPDLKPVSCFADDFSQIVFHLLMNATHAVRDTMGENEKIKGLITIKTQNCGDTASIQITDTGVGMSEQTRARIFDPFFTTRPVGSGMGQGLCIVHTAVVDKHQGTVAVESEPGRGTTVTVNLPLHCENIPLEDHAA